MKKNILILSVGTRNKIVQYFKQESLVDQLIIATDSSRYAPALYDADSYYVVPRIDDPNYLSTILDICEKNNVGLVLSLIDPELILISKNMNEFTKRGILPVISPLSIIELSFDKYEMFKFLTKKSINTVLTYDNFEDFKFANSQGKISFPVFVKPRMGSASIDIGIVDNLYDLERKFKASNDLIVQEYIVGKEFGADVYIDLISGRIIDIFVKQKIRMRAGETDKSVSVSIPEINYEIEKMLNLSDFRGIIDIDIFEKNGTYYISEINPRFGGGYPHAYESGMNVPKMINNNLLYKANKFNDTRIFKESLMLKYNEVKIII